MDNDDFALDLSWHEPFEPPLAMGEFYRFLRSNGRARWEDGYGQVWELCPSRPIQRSDVEPSEFVGTQITFIDPPEPGHFLARWIDEEDLPTVMQRLRIFCRTGADGSCGALWRDDDGSLRIVQLGTGSGARFTGTLANNFVDFLRLLAIGYEELCWADELGAPPDRSSEYAVAIDENLRSWVSQTFSATIPSSGVNIVSPFAFDGDPDSDAFYLWIREYLL